MFVVPKGRCRRVERVVQRGTCRRNEAVENGMIQMNTQYGRNCVRACVPHGNKRPTLIDLLAIWVNRCNAPGPRTGRAFAARVGVGCLVLGAKLCTSTSVSMPARLASQSPAGFLSPAVCLEMVLLYRYVGLRTCTLLQPSAP